MEPVVEQMRLPVEYGTPTVLLAWAVVEERLRSAPHYWLATVRPDGRPHTVPVDGIWTDGALVVGGVPHTVHARNLTSSPVCNVHLEDTEAATILEGTAALDLPTAAQAHDLAAASRAKYGYAPPVEAFEAGVWRVRPSVVLAWTEIHRDATRFRFG